MRHPLACVALVLALPFAACAESSPEYPPECSNGPASVRKALAKAPDGEVAIEGVHLSECLVASADSGPLQSFGGSVLTVATQLVQRDRGGDQAAAARLGFLRGALVRGADPGVHDELIRRFDQELLRVDRGAPAFRRGEAAGRERG